jgi:hypothetical protein
VWGTIGTKSTTVGGTGSGSLTWVTGDIILVLGIGADTGVTLGTPTATGLTFTQQTSSTITSACTGYAWTATAASGGSGAIQVVPGRTNANDFWGIIAWVVHGSDGIGTKSAGADTAQTISLATTQDNSAVFEVIGDWGTGSVAGHTWTPSGQTEREASQNGTAYTVYAADWADRGTAGTVSYGVSVTASGQNYTKIAIEMLGTTASVSGGTGVQPLVPAYFCCPPWPAVPPVTITASRPLGNPAVPTPQPVVVGPEFAPAPIPGALVFGPGAPAAVVVSAATPQPLVVSPEFVPAPLTPAQIFSPTAVATTNPALVVSPPYQPVPTPPVSITSSQPLGNPAVGSPEPLVVSTPWTSKVPGALLFGPGAPTAAVVTGSTPGPLVVTPPFTPVPIPVTYLSASQPLGNPAVGTPGPLVVGPPFIPVPVPGARISGNPAAPVISTTGTPQPLVVGPPNLPVPVPHAYLSSSFPLGNPAVGTPQPLVVSTFTLAPVPGAKVFAAPAAPTVPAVPTPGPLVVTPPWQPVPIPKTYFSASYPLGNQPPPTAPGYLTTLTTVAGLDAPTTTAGTDTTTSAAGYTVRTSTGGSGTTSTAAGQSTTSTAGGG